MTFYIDSEQPNPKYVLEFYFDINVQRKSIAICRYYGVIAPSTREKIAEILAWVRAIFNPSMSSKNPHMTNYLGSDMYTKQRFLQFSHRVPNNVKNKSTSFQLTVQSQLQKVE